MWPFGREMSQALILSDKIIPKKKWKADVTFHFRCVFL